MADVTGSRNARGEFRVRPFGTDDRVRSLDHLSDGERRAVADGLSFATLNRRYMRWN